MRIQFLTHSRNPQKEFPFFSSSIVSQTAGALNLPFTPYFQLSSPTTPKTSCPHGIFVSPLPWHPAATASWEGLFTLIVVTTTCANLLLEGGVTSNFPCLGLPPFAASKVHREPWEWISSLAQPEFLRRNSSTEFWRKTSGKLKFFILLYPYRVSHSRM